MPIRGTAMSWNGVKWPACALVLFLAGCTGGGGSAQSVSAPSEASFGEDEGAVNGRVYDEEILPVVDANVGLLELKLETRTDAEGRFIFSHLVPGNYTLGVARLGYEPYAKHVTVTAGASLDVDVTLKVIQVRTAYKEIWTDRGFFECSWHGPIWAGPCFFPGPETPQPNNKRAWNYPVGAGLETLVNELRWGANSLATGSMLRETFSYANRTTGHWYCDAEGNSVLQLRWDRAKGCVSGGDQLPSAEPKVVPLEGQQVRTFVNSGAAGPPIGLTEMGMAFQQSFEIWTSEFYWEAAPEGYTAVP